MGEETKSEEKKEEVPEEIVLRVFMHCEACAKKVAKSLSRFEGVEDVKTDYKTHTVVVKGKTADPIKICERVHRKSGRKVELISPLPKPPEEEKKEEEPENKEEKKDEPPPVITVVLLVNMHCEACAQLLRKRIRKMEGVESVDTDLTNGQVVVKGVLDPEKLVETVYKKTGKQAHIVPPPPPPPEEEKKEEEKKEEEKKEEEKKEGEGENQNENIKKYEHWPRRYYVEYGQAPQIFSDENPNACSVM